MLKWGVKQTERGFPKLSGAARQARPDSHCTSSLDKGVLIMKRPFLAAAISSALGLLLLPAASIYAQDSDDDDAVGEYEPEEVLVTA